jgi:hypothetical protein
MNSINLIVISVVIWMEVQCNSFGTTIVYDPINHGTNIVNEVTNLGHWVATQLSAAQTSLNTLNTYEQTVLQVERMGDPKTLVANLPGVQNLQTLEQIYTQGVKDVSDWAAFVNPQSWKLTADQILQIYGQPGLSTFTSSNGLKIGTAQSLFQFNVTNYNALESAKQTVTRLTQQLQTETKDLATATSAMQSATTTSAVQKYQSTIASLHASIDTTKAALQAAELSLKLQTEQTNTAQRITQAAQAQATQIADYKVIDQGLNGLPMGQMQTPMLFGTRP